MRMIYSKEIGTSYSAKDFLVLIVSGGRLEGVENNGKFKTVILTHKWWSFTRSSSNYKALTGKILVFWISGR